MVYDNSIFPAIVLKIDCCHLIIISDITSDNSSLDFPPLSTLHVVNATWSWSLVIWNQGLVETGCGFITFDISVLMFFS